MNNSDRTIEKHGTDQHNTIPHLLAKHWSQVCMYSIKSSRLNYFFDVHTFSRIFVFRPQVWSLMKDRTSDMVYESRFVVVVVWDHSFSGPKEQVLTNDTEARVAVSCAREDDGEQGQGNPLPSVHGEVLTNQGTTTITPSSVPVLWPRPFLPGMLCTQRRRGQHEQLWRLPQLRRCYLRL